jgi:hypothetical protein
LPVHALKINAHRGLLLAMGFALLVI